ncbi:MAG: phenylalanine--tRNA ligase subunit alpha [Saprospiraceae bacterium]|nr:phenylalanine--tRNA ligase subunit alpha [Saprospiraceae bacterium]
MDLDWREKLKLLEQEIGSFEMSKLEDVERFRIKYLGSKNVLKDYFALMGQIPATERKEFGAVINSMKDLANELFTKSKDQFEESKRKSEPVADLSLPGLENGQGSRHPISIVMDRIVEIFSKIGFEVAEEREIEDDWHNFTALNTPDDHPARDMQDTFYLKDFAQHLLRTHTSSVQARYMTQNKPPFRILAPGRVYRNETVSARSHCQFHQVEGLYVDKGVSMADLKQTLLFFAKEMFGEDVKIRLRPSYFPFTEPSAEMDIYWGLKDETDHRITKGTGWLEILGCGMVDPAVLENCGIDPKVYSGFAFGMGIERQAMLLYKIPDIRYYFENDLRFLKQFKPIMS